MTKIEAKTGQELVAHIAEKAYDDLQSEGFQVSGLGWRYIELLNKRQRPAESTMDKTLKAMTHAQRRFAGTLNIIDFFCSLDEESHVGNAEPLEMPDFNEL
jgi:hypothetical protein